MLITTEEQFLQLFKSKSRILNRVPDDPRTPPRYFECMDFSLKGIIAMLSERLDESSGTLHFAREAVKQHLREWDGYNRAQVKKSKKPVGTFAEKINRARARVELIAAEARELNRLLDVEKSKAASQAAAIHRHLNGNVKMKNGKPFMCDGRELVVDAEGVVKFQDDGELLENYLDKVVESKRAKAAAKHKSDQERRERVNQARGIQKKQRAVPQTV